MSDLSDQLQHNETTADEQTFDPMEHLLGREIRRSRLFRLAVIGFSLVLVLLSVGVGAMNVYLITENVRLSDERVMYGLPDAGGTFKSAQQRPAHVIEVFVQGCLNNMLNVSPATISVRTDRAVSCFDFRRQGTIKAILDERNQGYIADSITQQYIEFANSIVKKVEDGQTYLVYKSSGVLSQRTSTQTIDGIYVMEPESASYEVKMVPVLPTEGYFFGVSILEVTQNNVGS